MKSNNTKYTPGSWAVRAESDTNVRLILAAPDLLSACEIVLNNLELLKPTLEFDTELDLLSYKACIDAMNEAINKAKGGAE